MMFVSLVVMLASVSVSLTLEIHGEIIRGYPCIKRYNQLYCPTPGNNYPSSMINYFIDENKALVRRMFGEFQVPVVVDSSASEEDDHEERDNENEPSMVSAVPRDLRNAYNITVGHRVVRAAKPFMAPNTSSNRVDSCESSLEIVTPYWASNSAGKIRAVVNTQHFEQAVQQEVCQNVQTRRCSGDCSCEQKYKWHRLMSYDPEDNCKGIFMDWFMFPSCCVCKCARTPAAPP